MTTQRQPIKHSIPTIEALLDNPQIGDLLVMMYESTKLLARSGEHFNFEQAQQSMVEYYEQTGEKSFGQVGRPLCDETKNTLVEKELAVDNATFVAQNLQIHDGYEYNRISFRIRTLIEKQKYDQINNLVELFLENNADFTRLKTIYLIFKKYDTVILARSTDNVLEAMKTKFNYQQ